MSTNANINTSYYLNIATSSIVCSQPHGDYLMCESSSLNLTVELCVHLTHLLQRIYCNASIALFVDTLTLTQNTIIHTITCSFLIE